MLDFTENKVIGESLNTYQHFSVTVKKKPPLPWDTFFNVFQHACL
jgi:hypothetical protein